MVVDGGPHAVERTRRVDSDTLRSRCDGNLAHRDERYGWFHRTFLTTGGCVEADLLVQPPMPIEPSRLTEVVSRVIPANLLGLRRGCV